MWYGNKAVPHLDERMNEMKKKCVNHKDDTDKRMPDYINSNIKILTRKYKLCIYLLSLPQAMGLLMLVYMVVYGITGIVLPSPTWIILGSFFVPCQVLIDPKFRSDCRTSLFNTKRVFVVSMMISVIEVVMALWAYIYMSKTAIVIVAIILTLVSTILTQLNRYVFSYEITSAHQSKANSYEGGL